MTEDPRTFAVLTERAGVLRRLAEGPVHKRDLADELDYSRRTVDRAITELESVDLVERRDEGFTATTTGRLALERLDGFRADLGDVVAAETAVSPLPDEAPIGAAAVTGAEVLTATDSPSYRPLGRFHDALADADRYRVLLPALADPRHVRLLYDHAVVEGQPAELVVSPELLAALRTEFPRRAAAMADSDDFGLFVGEVPPFVLALVEPDPGADSEVYLVVFSEQGGDVHGVVINDSRQARRWAEQLYESVRADATERTDALRPDPDGGVEPVDADGGAVRAALGRSVSVALEREGFVRLGVSYFRDEPVADPTTAWRAGLTLPEVHTGYAVERSLDADGEADQAGWQAMTEALVADLAAGRDCVVLGPPGSGKSTVCKQVACAWYEAGRGPVLYREQGRGRPFRSVEDLVVTVDAADGHTLVVVEDAVRPEVNAVFDAIDRLGDREDVSFLLDARDHEWRNPPDDLTDVPLSVVHMPPFGDADARRLIEHFERTVGADVGVPVDRLREAVSDEAFADEEAAASEVLLLLHRLSRYADPLADGQTSLEEAVAAVYDDIADDGVALDVCVLACTLNAAGLAVTPASLYAVAPPEEFDAVDAGLDRLEGRVLFPRDDGTYRTVHESWSVTFLEHLLATDGASGGARRFGDCVTALLALAEESDRRRAIAHHVDAEAAWTVAAIEDDPGEWTEETVEAVYALGQERPTLTPLYGDGEHDSVTLPEACPAHVAADRLVWLGRMFLAEGEYDSAERAFERLSRDDPDRKIEYLLGLSRVKIGRSEYDEAIEHAEACLDLAGDADRQTARARAQLRLGIARSGLAEYEAAEPCYRAALEQFEAVGDRRRAARTLNNIGSDAYKQSDYDTAEEFLQRSLEMFRDLGDRRGEADALNDLATTAREQGKYDQAREYHEEGLALARELGDRHGVARNLSNLAIVFDIQGEHDRAREYFEEALAMYRDIGDHQGEAGVLANLGKSAESQGEYGRAREYFERSREIFREVGNPGGEAITTRNLGIVARIRGEYGRAREHFEESLALSREMGDRHGEASSHRNLGVVARRLDERDRAGEQFRQALAIAREIGHPREEASSLRGLGELARTRGDYERAEAHLAAAFDCVEQVDDRAILARVRLSQARLALDRGDPPTARERAGRARETLAAMTMDYWEARSRRLLGQVAADAGDGEAAREHWQAGLATFEDVGASRDALTTVRYLVEACRAEGQDDQAAEHLRRAEALLADAPDPVADQHTEWVEEQRAALGTD